jgi:hypothetical protein
MISNRAIAQDDWLSGCAESLSQVGEEIQGFTPQPTAVRVATSAAQFGSVLCFTGTNVGDVVATRSITIDMPIEPNHERRRYDIAE